VVTVGNMEIVNTREPRDRPTDDPYQPAESFANSVHPTRVNTEPTRQRITLHRSVDANLLESNISGNTECPAQRSE
jgi:hypothetical protein